MVFCAKSKPFMIKIAIFASGNGSNAENIIHYFSKNSQATVALVVSNNKDAYVHIRAESLGVPSCSFNKAEFESGTVVLDTLREYDIDFIVLAGFLLRFHNFLDAYPNKIVNIHPRCCLNMAEKGCMAARASSGGGGGETESGYHHSLY